MPEPVIAVRSASQPSSCSLTSDRLHASLARVLESAEEPLASLLAHHWDEAGEALPAVQWHRRAADEVGLVAQAEMLRHWRRVSELLERLPETHENLVLAATARAQILWTALRTRTDPEEAEKLYSEALVLAERSGDRATLSGAHRAYAAYLLLAGEPGGIKLAEESVRAADEAGDAATRVAALYSLAWLHGFGATRPTLGLQRAEAGLELVGDDLELGADLIGYSPRLMLDEIRSAMLCQLGRLDEAARGFDWLVKQDAEVHPVPVAAARCYRILLAERKGDAAEALAGAQRLAEDLERQPRMIETVVITAMHALGVAHAVAEHWDDAIASLDDSLAHARAGQTALMWSPETLVWKARALIGKGQLDAAPLLVDEAIDRARHQEGSLALANALLMRAKLRVAREPESLDRIESDIDEAAAIIEGEAFGAYAPDLHEARATLARLRGDEPGWRRELERARDLARDMGAPMRAERIAALLS